MTLGEIAGLGLKVHGAVFLAAAAAYYKFGDRTDLVEKSHKSNRTAKKIMRDRIASDLLEQLRPVVRTAINVRSPLFNADGDVSQSYHNQSCHLRRRRLLERQPHRTVHWHGAFRLRWPNWTIALARHSGLSSTAYQTASLSARQLERFDSS